eukprot:12896303-Prorocentrum_lima.AAC.1
MAGTNMFRWKVEEHILLGFGHGSSHPRFLLGLVQSYVVFIINHDRLIQLIPRLMKVGAKD